MCKVMIYAINAMPYATNAINPFNAGLFNVFTNDKNVFWHFEFQEHFV